MATLHHRRFADRRDVLYTTTKSYACSTAQAREKCFGVVLICRFLYGLRYSIVGCRLALARWCTADGCIASIPCLRSASSRTLRLPQTNRNSVAPGVEAQGLDRDFVLLIALDRPAHTSYLRKVQDAIEMSLISGDLFTVDLCGQLNAHLMRSSSRRVRDFGVSHGNPDSRISFRSMRSNWGCDGNLEHTRGFVLSTNSAACVDTTRPNQRRSFPQLGLMRSPCSGEDVNVHDLPAVNASLKRLLRVAADCGGCRGNGRRRCAPQGHPIGFACRSCS